MSYYHIFWLYKYHLISEDEDDASSDSEIDDEEDLEDGEYELDDDDNEQWKIFYIVRF